MTSTWGHHKWAVKPACTLSGTLAGKMYFQILATDNYVSNNNKPFLPGMLKLNHHSVSIYSRQRALELLQPCSLQDCVNCQWSSSLKVSSPGYQAEVLHFCIHREGIWSTDFEKRESLRVCRGGKWAPGVGWDPSFYKHGCIPYVFAITFQLTSHGACQKKGMFQLLICWQQEKVIFNQSAWGWGTHLWNVFLWNFRGKEFCKLQH